MVKFTVFVLSIFFILPNVCFSAVSYDFSSFSSQNISVDDNNHWLLSDSNEYLLAPNSKNNNELILKNKDNQILWQITPFVSFQGEISAQIGNDKNEKIIVAAPKAGGGPEIKIFSASGVLQKSFFAFDQHFRGGLSFTLADINDDQKDEIIAAKGITGEPKVAVFDLSGLKLFEFLAYDKSFTGGFDIAAGDINGDLKKEIITSAGFGGGPHVRIFNSQGNLLNQFFSYDKNFSGGVNVLAADYNNDSKAEILTLPMQGGGPHLRVFNSSGALLFQDFVFAQNTKAKFYFSFDKINNKLIADYTDEITGLEIPVPVYLQEKNLSCEAASLRMVLAFKGIYLSENEVFEKIPQAYPLEFKNNIWADPNVGFVGNVNGSQTRKTGYGVYWEPIAKTANLWVPAQSFNSWTFNKLLEQLSANNPVIIWGSYDQYPKDISWKTPENKYIKAYAGEHTYIVSGFKGNIMNPEKIIVIDSLSGKKELSKDVFHAKMEIV